MNIKNWSISKNLSSELSQIINHIADLTKAISEIIRSNPTGYIKYSDTKNSSGDIQSNLDIYLDSYIQNSLLNKTSVVAAIASEEQKNIVKHPINTTGKPFIIAYDPLDGSSNFNVNSSIGSIYSIIERRNLMEVDENDFFVSSRQISAIYAIYGSYTTLVVAIKNSVNEFILVNDSWVINKADLKIPSTSSTICINASRKRHWNKATKAYIEDCFFADDKSYNTRWLGCLAGDANRVITQGGIFMYPSDKVHKEGLIRVLFEGRPIAFIVQQASGKSTDGYNNYLDIEIHNLHQRLSIIFGSSEDVDLIKKYFGNN